ncbi:MAG: AAA family ATPase [Opitutaceae bacterium]
MAASSANSDTLTGVLERIIFFNEENHYTIAELRPDSSTINDPTGSSIVRGTSDAKAAKVTITGPLPGVQCGETLHLTGGWTKHAQHGDQFKIAAFRSELPSSVYGIRKYLGSGLVEGIGKVYANKIVDAFGTATFRVLSEDSGKLRDVPGIGKKRALAIKKAWDDQHAFRELYIFLQTYGVTTGQCVKLIAKYGAEAKRVLTTEPYKVAREIDGIGFKTADRIAINLGYANDAPPRLDAGLIFAMETLQEEGHTAILEAALIDYAAPLLETEARYLEARINALVDAKQLVRHSDTISHLPSSILHSSPLPGTALLQLPANDRAEQKIAATVTRLGKVGSGLPPIKTDAAVEWAEQKAGFTFADQQRAGLKNALVSKISILTGGPGTGKAQPLTAQVLTPGGFRPLGSLRTGTLVVTAEGKTTSIKGVYPQGEKDIYRVTFADGRSTLCCDDHLWRAWTRVSVWSPAKKKKIRARDWRVVPLSYLRKRIAEDRAEKNRIAVPLLSACPDTPPQPFFCDPYVIGALIGDGTISTSTQLTTTDAFVREKIRNLIAPLGLTLKPVTLHGADTISYRLTHAKRGLPNSLGAHLRSLGLNVGSPAKFIPEIFFSGSLEQRRQLIRGLLDTDGTVDKHGAVSFSSSSLRLARDFQRLAWSLGCIATLGATKHPTYTHRGEKRTGPPAHTVFIQHPEPATLLSLPRKLARLQRPNARKRLSHRLRITSIEPAGRTACACISVDSPSGLYVTDDYIVTHNTTILRALVDILKAKKVRVHLAAPTGRAAQRLAETTGGFASTIHRLLKYDPAGGGFVANEHQPLATDFLIVDEASMLDTRLAAALLQAVPSRAHLLLVGDIDQLPSVGAGNVLKDLIATQQVPVTRLNVIYRQKGQSQIVTTAHAINAGEPGLPPSVNEVSAAQAWSDLTFIVADSAEDCIRKTIQLCTEFIPAHYAWFNPINDVQILAPMHKGVAGVSNLNVQLQAALNPHAKGLRGPHGEYRPRDKVIQLRNNYDKSLFNGDIGVIKSVDTEAGTLTASFDGDEHTFDRGEFGDLAPAYAISIHKSQGSEYPVVIVPLLKGHFMMLQRNLLYTAITRGKKKVFIVGEPAAYGMAVRNNEARDRTTHLREKIATLQT